MKSHNLQKRAGEYRRTPFILVLLFLVVVASCSPEGEGDKWQQEYEIDRLFRRGPVSFRVALSREEVTIADHVTMLLEARAEQGYSVELPRFGDKLHQFGIVDYSSPPPELADDGMVVTRRQYELEPFLSGDYQIPPMTVSFWEEGDTLLHTLESDTVAVHVKSILPEDHAGLEIRDIAGPVSFPSNPYRPFLIACGIVAAAAIVFLLWRRRREKIQPVPELPPHELAFMRLEQLLSSKLLEEKQYRVFTTLVSDILRHYIEDRFRLRAPERTTEEFLLEARTGLSVDQSRKEILKEFLSHCDLVKFAALEPSSGDVKRTFETCRDFIDATKGEEEVKEEAA